MRRFVCWRQTVGSSRQEKLPVGMDRSIVVGNVDSRIGSQHRAGYHDGIIMDDMSFTHLPATSIIHLLDVENTRSIHCRNTNASIPAGMPRVFTINNLDQLFFDPESESQNDAQKYNYCSPEQLAAITRRYVHCTLPLGLEKYYK